MPHNRYLRYLFCIVVFVSALIVVFSYLNLYDTYKANLHELNYALYRSEEKNIENVLETKLWYDPKTPYDDRILNQLNHIPKAYKLSLEKGILPRNITILRYQGLKSKMYGAFFDPQGNIFEKCLVNRCELIGNRSRQSEVDAIVFESQHPQRTPDIFPTKQIWIIYYIEGPFSSYGLKPGDQFNWTATYRPDSTLSVPHYKYISNSPSSGSKYYLNNYAKGKTKKVAWFVSHCNTSNKRMEYARQLSRYIPVDIYGKCGNKSCKMWGRECFNILRRDYKFYLSFENSNCRHYITEKLVRNALMTDTLPIVMGPPPEDYVWRAPPNSYIHVDDFESPRHLADYLHVLDKNDRLYSNYFKWKGTGHFMGAQTTNFWCRLCAMLHEQDSNPRPPSWYEDTNKWWRGEGICIGPENWRKHLV